MKPSRICKFAVHMTKIKLVIIDEYENIDTDVEASVHVGADTNTGTNLGRPIVIATTTIKDTLAAVVICQVCP